ncbi:NAD(P)/FAD-dependent oxidoreductase [Acuticoccus sediminis]|uniref:NAD(P)/FAD-dependent oxidoreductase n=1 Tax=Acuticoccus sediminis TaxID=2184697 RepID=UPI001CFD4705|nr:FAD-dependent monooxygenase [Acuticoccus sediminis]
MVRPAGRGVYEVAVAGGGPAGAATAAILAGMGCRVVLLDARDARVPHRPAPGEVLTPNAVPALAALDLLERLEGDPDLARPLHAIVRRWPGRPVETEPLIGAPGGRGFVVDRPRFDAMLLARCEAAGVTVRRATRVMRLTRADGWRLGTDAGETVRAAVVVDATGRAARVARQVSARRVAGHRLIALCGTCDAAIRAGTLVVAAFDRATPPGDPAAGGWWYAVAAPSGLSFALLGSDTGDLRRGAGRDRLAVMADALGLPAETLCDARLRVADATPSRLKLACGPGWLAVGDAAASFDPIASQGLANALASAPEAAKAALSMLECDATPALAYADAVAATWQRTADIAPHYQPRVFERS